MSKGDYFDPEKKDQLLGLLGGDKELLNSFMDFKSKEREREIRTDIADHVKEIISGLDEDLTEDWNAAQDLLDSIYRKAWDLACIDMGYKVFEYPCKT